jgi:hypothetical protein
MTTKNTNPVSLGVVKSRQLVQLTIDGLWKSENTQMHVKPWFQEIENTKTLPLSGT